MRHLQWGWRGDGVLCLPWRYSPLSFVCYVSFISSTSPSFSNIVSEIFSKNQEHNPLTRPWRDIDRVHFPGLCLRLAHPLFWIQLSGKHHLTFLFFSSLFSGRENGPFHSAESLLTCWPPHLSRLSLWNRKHLRWIAIEGSHHIYGMYEWSGMIEREDCAEKWEFLADFSVSFTPIRFSSRKFRSFLCPHVALPSFFTFLFLSHFFLFSSPFLSNDVSSQLLSTMEAPSSSTFSTTRSSRRQRAAFPQNALSLSRRRGES